MARTARLVIPEVSLHVVQRGHDRSACFFDRVDYLAYLDALSNYAIQFQCSIHAYCLMTNHVHLLLTPHEPTGCGQLMKHVAQRYSKRINFRHSRSGTLWEGRFHSSLITTDHYALACYRYIEFNPVRAGMAMGAEDYPWSSYRANAAIGMDRLVKPHPSYEALGIEAQQRAAAYRQLCATPLQQNDIDEIRKAIRSGQAVGTKRRPPGRPPRQPGKLVTVTN